MRILFAIAVVMWTVSSSAYAQRVIPVPGRIQVENYDLSLDRSQGNAGSGCRSGDVDLYQSWGAPPVMPTPCVLGGTEAGEWLAYRILVAETGDYVLSTRSSSAGPGGWFYVEIDGANVTGRVRVSNTGDWGLFATTRRHRIHLTEGLHTLKLTMDTESEVTGIVGAFDYLALTASVPFAGSPSAVPGRIEVEDFDRNPLGPGLGFAYHDTTIGNSGGAYRVGEAVDISPTTDSHGVFEVNGTTRTEWLAYTVSVAATGLYALSVRVANAGGEGAFHFEMDGKPITEILTIPEADQWTHWQTISVPRVWLEQGQHVLYLVIDGVPDTRSSVSSRSTLSARDSSGARSLPASSTEIEPASSRREPSASFNYFTLESLAGSGVPYQWIAKQYAEGLGRGPDPGGWNGSADFFEVNGCDQTNLKSSGHGFLTSSEFEEKGYNNAQRVFVAYRAIMSREPDQGGFDIYVDLLNNGSLTWSDVINIFYDSGEFAGLIPTICGGSHYSDDLGGNRPIPIGGQRSQSTLQSQLNAGGTICLNPQEVVYITTTLSIPSSATLRTCAATNKAQTAKFGRLIRDSTFTGTLVSNQGTIDRVWIDGQRARFGYSINSMNVRARRGTVTNSRIAEPRGWTNVHAFEGDCTGSPRITNNLITAYTTPHGSGQFADGLSLACNGTYAADNFIIDATDVGVVTFAKGSTSGQNMIIERNVVLAAGRSAFAAYGLCDAIGQFGKACTGSYLRNNELFTSAYEHFDIGITVGAEAWGPGTAIGGRVENNFTRSGVTARVKAGIVVDGLSNTYVVGNNLATIAVATDPGNSCTENGGVVAHTADSSHASGTIQSHTSAANHACIGPGE